MREISNEYENIKEFEKVKNGDIIIYTTNKKYQRWGKIHTNLHNSTFPTQCVIEVETDSRYYFSHCTPIQALEKMIYSLFIKNGSYEPCINKTKSGNHLWFEHKGLTYVIKTNQ